MSYQQVTVTVIVKEEDVETIEREFHQTLEMLAEDYKLHNASVSSDVCEEPELEEQYVLDEAA